MEDAVTWSEMVWILLLVLGVYALEMWWLWFRRARQVREEIAANAITASGSIEALQRQLLAVQRDMLALSARMDILARQQTLIQKQQAKLQTQLKNEQDKADDDPEIDGKPLKDLKKNGQKSSKKTKPNEPEAKAAVIPLRADTLSPVQRQAIALAKKGISSDKIAEQCDMPLAEVEMLAALYCRLADQ